MLLGSDNSPHSLLLLVSSFFHSMFQLSYNVAFLVLSTSKLLLPSSCHAWVLG